MKRRSPFVKRAKKRRGINPPSFLPGARGSAEWHITYAEKPPYQTVNFYGTTGQMRLPAGDDVQSQFVRTHELMHAAHSPVEPPRPIKGAGVNALLAVEEYRLNRFIMEHYFDGDPEEIRSLTEAQKMVLSAMQLPFTPESAEVLFGQIMALTGILQGTTSAARTMMLMVPNSKIELPDPRWRTWFIEGLWWLFDNGWKWPGKTKYWSKPPEWKEYVVPLAEVVQELFDKWHQDVILEEIPELEGEDLINILDPHLEGSTPFTEDAGEPKWGELRIGEARFTKKLPLYKRPKGKKATDIGIAPVYIHRTLIDAKPFAKKVKEPGATLLIDASGSMSWRQTDLDALVQAVPATTIATYSGNGISGTLLIIAKDGKWAPGRSSPGGGNDVDLPALEWLAKQAEPRIWVTDGGVVPIYGSHQKARLQCALFAQENNINVVRTVREARAIFEGRKALHR